MEITNKQIEEIKKLEQELYEEVTKIDSENVIYRIRVARWSTAFDIMNEILGIEPDRLSKDRE